MKNICLTGIKPTGDIHLGNYFGSTLPLFELSLNPEFDEILLFIANYHTMNFIKDPKVLKKNTESMAIDLISMGLDVSRTKLFYQSAIPELTELAWIFNNVVTVAYLERSHAYKDAIQNGKEANMGLFAYPVLMASDILIYDSTIVPVGKDQKQHVEISQKIAKKFNSLYGDTFIIPKPFISAEVELIKGLDGRKMSKSYNNTINIFEDEKTLHKKVMAIKTDSKGPNEPKNPDECNIMHYHRLLLDKKELQLLEIKYQEGSISYKESKEILFENLNQFLKPMIQKRGDLLRDKSFIQQILKDGAEFARGKAIEKMKVIREKVGLI